MLRDLGYTYVRRDRAADALDLVLTGEAFDLMLSDMIMPGDMDGLALAEAVSSHRPDLPVVLMTGYSEAAATAAASSFRLLRKPYRIDDLASTLDAALAGRKVAAPSRKAAT
jgi:DNA-binding NtrC family response regulator